MVDVTWGPFFLVTGVLGLLLTGGTLYWAYQASKGPRDRRLQELREAEALSLAVSDLLLEFDLQIAEREKRLLLLLERVDGRLSELKSAAGRKESRRRVITGEQVNRGAAKAKLEKRRPKGELELLSALAARQGSRQVQLAESEKQPAE